MEIMELEPCISPGSHYQGVSSACRTAASGSSGRRPSVTAHIASSKPLPCLLPKRIASSLPFTAELFHVAFPAHSWLADSRCRGLPCLPLAILLPCSDCKLPTPLWAFSPLRWERGLGPSSLSLRSPMGKQSSLNPFTLSNHERLGFVTQRICNRCMHTLSFKIPVILKKILRLRILILIPLTIPLNATSTLSPWNLTPLISHPKLYQW